VKTHFTLDGVIRYGTSAFSGGTKVYLCGRYWRAYEKEIQVIGLTRGKKYQVHSVPVELIENVRCKTAYKPAILGIMNHWEFYDCWWHDTEDDKKATEKFVKLWNNKSENDGKEVYGNEK
jgi:hypothetical protein